VANGSSGTSSSGPVAVPLLDSRQPGRRAHIIDPTRWPLAVPSPLCVLHRLPPDHMKLLVWLFGLIVLASAPGCAKTDWIDWTLVTVDVTGV